MRVKVASHRIEAVSLVSSPVRTDLPRPITMILPMLLSNSSERGSSSVIAAPFAL
jgi:hypothetical protein